MDPRSVALLAGREMRDAWRNRWFLLFAAAFTVVALVLAWLSVTGVAGTGYAGFGRTAASLVNLVVLVVPLMGLVLGAGSVAAERERGSLLFLLAQPVAARELVVGKFLGLSGALLASILAGFGLAGLALAVKGDPGPPGPYLAFLALAAALGMAAIAIGLLISTLARRQSVAAGVALFAWLLLVFLGDLGLMGTAVTLRMGPEHLLAASLANPLQLFKVASLLVVRGGLEVLGPAGLYLTRAWGDAALPALSGLLALWVLAPLGAAAVVLERRGGLP